VEDKVFSILDPYRTASRSTQQILSGLTPEKKSKVVKQARGNLILDKVEPLLAPPSLPDDLNHSFDDMVGVLNVGSKLTTSSSPSTSGGGDAASSRVHIKEWEDTRILADMLCLEDKSSLSLFDKTTQISGRVSPCISYRARFTRKVVCNEKSV